MIKCQACGSPNLYGSQYCDECGTKLMTKRDETDNNNNASNVQTRIADIPVFQSSNVTSVGIPSIVEVIKEAEKSLEEKTQAKAKASIPH
jgi:uncharacterized membrane protein YvbJ